MSQHFAYHNHSQIVLQTTRTVCWASEYNKISRRLQGLLHSSSFPISVLCSAKAYIQLS